MSQAPSLTLPGGVAIGNRLHREVVLKPLTGLVEKALGEAAADVDNIPGMISEILALALQSVGDQPVDRRLAGSLCVADRQYLMLKLAQLLEGDQLWLQSVCNSCGEPFEISIERAALPVLEAVHGYPITEVELDGRRLQLRVPTGDDQEAIAPLDDVQAMRSLVARSIVSVEPETSHEALIDRLSQVELEAIEAALDAISPAVCTVTETRCPDCGNEQRVALDPYSIPGLDLHRLYREVHSLAIWYHWSEPAILELPRERRHLYLTFIDQTRGLHG